MHWEPRARLAVIRERARLYRQIREFFSNRGVLEVDTPLLLPSANPDPNIQSLSLEIDGTTAWLQTSPEFAMKRLLAAESGPIFQIAHAFRAGESGRRHNLEFALLEWYRVDYDYRQLMDEIELLLLTLSRRPCKFSRVRYFDLFREQLGIEPAEIALAELRQRCAAEVPGTDSSDYAFDECLDLLLGVVIARLKDFLFVYDYPL